MSYRLSKSNTAIKSWPIQNSSNEYEFGKKENKTTKNDHNSRVFWAEFCLQFKTELF